MVSGDSKFSFRNRAMLINPYSSYVQGKQDMLADRKRTKTQEIMAETQTGVGDQRTNFDENRHITGYSSDQEVTNAATILCEVSSSNLGQKATTDKEDDGSSTHPQRGTVQEGAERRSQRKRRPVRRLSLSPLEEEPTEGDGGEGAYGGTEGEMNAPPTAQSDVPSRTMNDQELLYKRGPKRSQTFSCDICKSNFIISPKIKKGKGRRSWRLSVRYWHDPESNKKLRLCNACGLRATRNRNTRKAGPASEEDKNKYFASVQKFSQSLVTELKDPDAGRLACPYFRTRTPCACIQKYIIGSGTEMEEAKKRASQLLQLMKEAQRLRSKKFYNVEDAMKKTKKQRKVGIGNGQRKSLEYQELVLSKRAVLKDQLKFCEHATKRILHYSNNFLHKRLKTDPVARRRLEGEGAGGSGSSKKALKDIDALATEVCCDDRCVLLAHTHSVLLQKWRDRARSGQTEARRVLGEMLTPSGLKTNCHKFITMVTGCSAGTITRVEEQIRTTGGDREPPPHGLKKYWEQQQQRAGKVPAKKPAEPAVVPPTPVSIATTQKNTVNAQRSQSEEQLQDQLLQLRKMQEQLAAQQSQINQQQKTIEKQLSLMNRQKEQPQQSSATQYRHIQPHSVSIQTSKETIGIRPMSTPGDNAEGAGSVSGTEGINARVQQNMSQLLMDIQQQFANQQVLQIQQQLMDVSSNGSSNTSGPTSGATSEQPPPSYNVAVALANGGSLLQPLTTSGGQVILQALPVTCGDTITVQTQPMVYAPGVGITAPQRDTTGQQNNGGSQGQGSSAAAASQSFVMSIPDLIDGNSLEQIPVIGIPETETFTDAPSFSEDLQMTDGEFVGGNLEVTISDMTPPASHTPRSTAAILRRRPRNVAPVATTNNVEAGFPRVIVRPALDGRPFSELPGDMLMASDPLQALSSTNQNLVLQSIPVDTQTPVEKTPKTTCS